MANDKFSNDLLRLISSEFYLLVNLTVSREMYGKGYFALGLGEKSLVDQTVATMLATGYQLATPETLGNLEAPQQPAKTSLNPVGFQAPSTGKPSI
ncbi:MAG: hypothetical protein A3H94_04630 [Acidobacteria bacterium RIFCSPLOWO2_02_FULL_60_20]|nr:MAG: hypothetical protein A3H94_04630 [Acidobacteria bacterium RIFCSPLOWO2_02_FULL_60_20]